MFSLTEIITLLVKLQPYLGLRNSMTFWFEGDLTHWGRVTHMCVSRLTTIGSYNGLSPDRRQAIIWNNAGILLVGPLGTKLQWKLYKKSYICIQENAFGNLVREMAAILSRLQYVKRIESSELPPYIMFINIFLNSNVSVFMEKLEMAHALLYVQILCAVSKVVRKDSWK